MRLSGTLFRYILWDLLKIFMMASGALSGILSFGGLLRPLTQQGLDASQVGKMLAYFGPAMTAYSFPIAALFATTVVYGRLSADNEIVGARACGISHLSLAAPAFVMGLFVLAASLAMLLFVVPAYTLKIEQVVTSNIGQFISGRINRSHQIRFGETTVFAQQAYRAPTDPKQPDLQTVVLDSPTIVSFGAKTPDLRLKAPTQVALDALTKTLTDAISRGDARVHIAAGGVGPVTASEVEAADPANSIIIAMNVPIEPAAQAAAAKRMVEIRSYHNDALMLAEFKRDRRYRVPKDFHLAKQATVQVYPDPTGERYLMMIGFEKGSRFPREFVGAQQGGVESARMGPLPIESPSRENTKFMDIWQLKSLYANLSQSRKIRATVNDYIARDQMFRYLFMLRDELNGDTRSTVFNADQSWILEKAPGVQAYERSGELIASVPEGSKSSAVQFRATDGTTVINAKELRLRAAPDPREKGLDVTVDLHMAEVQTPEGPAPRKLISYPLKLAMPTDIANLQDVKVKDYLAGQAPPGGGSIIRLNREMAVLVNDIKSETYARLSFATSCLILVMLGCALGIMFRSGNFLSSFAVSFIPALLSITLIIAGQRVCGSVPFDYPKHPNPIMTGILLIWSGNAINLVIASILWFRLQRQ